jgi:DNA-binding beta-propeller fold protein YncE
VITRRGLLAGAVAGAAVPSVARAATPAAGPLQAKQKTVRRGRAIAVSADGRRVVVAHDQRRTIAIGTRLVDVGGQPLNVAVSPDGRVAAVTTAFWDEPGLAIVDLATATVRMRVKVGPAPSHVAFSPDGKRLVVTGGEQEGTVHVLETKTFGVVAKAPVGTVPRGVVATNASAWIALNGLDRIVRVDLKTGRVRRTLRTPRLPDQLALSPDGRRLLATHSADDRVSEIDVRTGKVKSHKAGRQPSAVGWTRRGRRLAVLGGAGEIVVLGTKKRTKVGGAPRGLALAGTHAWTVDSLTDKVAKVRA